MFRPNSVPLSNFSFKHIVISFPDKTLAEKLEFVFIAIERALTSSLLDAPKLSPRTVGAGAVHPIQIEQIIVSHIESLRSVAEITLLSLLQTTQRIWCRHSIPTAIEQAVEGVQVTRIHVDVCARARWLHVKRHEP
jgi:hypothetical protein